MIAFTKTYDRAAPLLLVVIAICGLVGGGLLHWFELPLHGESLWRAGALVVLVALCLQIVRSLVAGRAGVDLIAALSIGVGLALDQTLAAAIVAVMYAGGQQLENYAEGRARRDMTALLGRVARTAMRYQPSGLMEVPIEDLVPGNRILLRKGEVVPVDGRVSKGNAILDLSALTGEAVPVEIGTGGEVPSGATVVSAPFDLSVLRPSAQSTYAGIVRLVEAAQESRAPMVRLADRYALSFLAITLVFAGFAYWLSADPVRALAVLVVATPCPLILAVPVALISGMSKAAANGVLIKSGGALEALASVKIAVMDKTGTLTGGKPEVTEVICEAGFTSDHVLSLAAGLDQASGHVMATALIEAAASRGLTLASPDEVEEAPGEGLHGRVDGVRIAVGGRGYVARFTGILPPKLKLDDGIAVVHVAIDGILAARILLSDRIRADAADSLAAFRTAGVTRLVLASGDQTSIVERAATSLGLDAAHGELKPEDKVRLVEAERRHGAVMMVGDGVNDAPALALADVGVAMGARGSAASSEAADVVLLTDDLGRLPIALAIAQRSRRIALQSAIAGLCLSAVAMVAATFGYLSPVEGAVLQEVIDVAVILNALRALTPPKLATG